jgi:ABC-type multidrug transport system fused ATPase/permease subunit
MGSIGIQSSGKIINLITNDAEVVTYMILGVHLFWIGILETIAVLVVLWSYLGFSILLVVIYTIFVPILQMLYSKFIEIILYDTKMYC